MTMARGTRALGAFLAASVSAAFLVLSLLLILATSSPNGPFWLFVCAAIVCAIGVPVAAISGWANMAVALSPEPPTVRTRFKHSLAGVLIGLIAVALVVAFAGAGPRLGLGAQPADIAGGVGYAIAVSSTLFGIAAIYGLFGFGLPALAYGVLVETIWLRLVRRASRSRRWSASPAAEPFVAECIPPFRWFAKTLAIIGMVLAVASSVPAIIGFARADDPPGILYSALLAWLLTMLAPALIALAAFRRRSWRLLAATVPALLVIAFVVGIPTGLGHVAAAVAFAGAALVARGVDRVRAMSALLVALLLLAAPTVLQFATEKACWDIYSEGLGLEMRLSPNEPNGPSDVPILSSDCRDHSYSSSGAALGVVILIVASMTAFGANLSSFRLRRSSTSSRPSERIAAEI